MTPNCKFETNLTWRSMLPPPANGLGMGEGQAINGFLSHCSPLPGEKGAVSLREFRGNELVEFVDVLHESLKVRTHRDFLLWSQGRLQRFLPHDVLIAAFGNFTLRPIRFDLVSAIPRMRTERARDANLAPTLNRLFEYCNLHAGAPFQISMDDGIFPEDALEACGLDGDFRRMRSALVHAVKDVHGRQDCLYVLMSASAAAPASGSGMLEILLPYIDSALRRLAQDPGDDGAALAESDYAEADAGTLTSRELEIMEWVKNGKTNFEIGMILDISAFTVKNHLQRIFRKLNVVNRAQAVAKLGQALENEPA